MRIGIVNQHPREVLGGSEIQCDLIARELETRGHTICYVAPFQGKRSRIDVSYRVAQVPRGGSAILGALRDFAPDVVYWRFNKHSFRAVAKGLFLAGIPLVFAISSRNDVAAWLRLRRPVGWENISRSIRHWWNHRGFRYVAAVTTLNADFIGKLAVPRQYYVPNAMESDTDDFQWHRPYCAWIANIKSSKRPEMAVELAKALESWDVDVIMVGHIQAREYDWVKDSSQLPSNCHFMGPRSVSEVNGILAKSLLHVHTCEPEGFGNVFIQAWLQGRPSVSLGFDPGGYLGSENIGIDAGGEYERFVAAVRYLIRNSAHREEIGVRARMFAERTFSVTRLVGDLEKIFSEVVAANERG